MRHKLQGKFLETDFRESDFASGQEDAKISTNGKIMDHGPSKKVIQAWNKLLPKHVLKHPKTGSINYINLNLTATGNSYGMNLNLYNMKNSDRHSSQGHEGFFQFSAQNKRIKVFNNKGNMVQEAMCNPIWTGKVVKDIQMWFDPSSGKYGVRQNGLELCPAF